MTDFLELLLDFLSGYWPQLTAAGVALPAIGTAVRAFIRHPKSSPSTAGDFLSADRLLLPPLARPAYSDRMAYVLAELADLAYYRFEDGSFLSAAVAEAEGKETTAEMTTFLNQFSIELLGNRRDLGTQFLDGLLQDRGFRLLDVIDIDNTQGFVCKRDVADEPSYVVLAFRGTEEDVGDWLTDARCVPIVHDETKVHRGFHEAFTVTSNGSRNTVEKKVREILDTPAVCDSNGNRLPLFVTGHSLGGALALLATKMVVPDVDGACYTFGAPRVANYEYFADVKTPVYRVVNSSDVVPRVPPGAFMIMLIGIIRGGSWLLRFAPPVAALFDKLEALLDKLNGYRHFGDLRYLSDVAEGRFHDVRLLANPPAFDRVMWMWKRIAKTLFIPIHSHNMAIYRNKLRHIASERNRSARMPEESS